MVDKTVGVSTETATGMTVMEEVGTGPERGHFPEIMAIIELEAQAIVDPGQDPEPSTNRDRICCYKCREYDHIVRDGPTSREKGEVEQLQRMLNLGDEQTMTPSMSDTQEDLIRMRSEENLRANHLNL